MIASAVSVFSPLLVQTATRSCSQQDKITPLFRLDGLTEGFSLRTVVMAVLKRSVQCAATACHCANSLRSVFLVLVCCRPNVTPSAPCKRADGDH